MLAFRIPLRRKLETLSLQSCLPTVTYIEHGRLVRCLHIAYAARGYKRDADKVPLLAPRWSCQGTALASSPRSNEAGSVTVRVQIFDLKLPFPSPPDNAFNLKFNASDNCFWSVADMLIDGL